MCHKWTDIAVEQEHNNRKKNHQINIVPRVNKVSHGCACKNMQLLWSSLKLYALSVVVTSYAHDSLNK